MKHINKILFFPVAALAAVAMGACDKIDENERFIQLPRVETSRVVLLEEFTGQKCVNCPAAHEVIASLVDQYPENLIAVSIHGGPDSNSIGEDQMNGMGLRNTDGAAYSDSYGIASFPCAVVNRISGVITSDQWAAKIYEEVEKPSDVDMSIKAVLSADGKTLTIDSDFIPYDNISGNYQLWVVESGIQTLQLTPSGFKADYIHNHVFRGVVNGHNGKSISLTTREAMNLTHHLELSEKWNPENLEIVGFIYNKNGVVQAAKTKVFIAE